MPPKSKKNSVVLFIGINTIFYSAILDAEDTKGAWPFHQLAFYSNCLFITFCFRSFPFPKISPKCHFVKFPLRQFHFSSIYYCSSLSASSFCHYLMLFFTQFAVLSTCFINLLFHQLVVSLTCCFVNFLFHQLFVSSTCCFINLLFHQLVVSSTCCFVNLLFHQLVVS